MKRTRTSGRQWLANGRLVRVFSEWKHGRELGARLIKLCGCSRAWRRLQERRTICLEKFAGGSGGSVWAEGDWCWLICGALFPSPMALFCTRHAQVPMENERRVFARDCLQKRALRDCRKDALRIGRTRSPLCSLTLRAIVAGRPAARLS